MDPVQFVWLMGIGALIGGGIIGAIAYRNLAPARKEASNLKAELDQAREEMESYKTSVNSHFDKTSELVNELTQDYVKVYKHLAEGAQVLGDGREFTHVLEQHQGKVLISVDGESAVQDTIVSEVPADAPEVQEVSEPLDHVVEQEGSSEVDADIAAEVKEPESSESSAEPDEKSEPALNDGEADPIPEQSADRAESAKGSDGEAEKMAAKPGKQKRKVTSASDESKTEPAETA
ncbi:MAG: YhcB family protein [Gammaproteobacteria bacterium]|nr:YhcB family protein [Gammaproteobacteria bacterium]MDH3858373.1 YhcB family protein [Gammaproteobacteria bacterium]